MSVKPCEGLLRQPDNTIEKRFSQISVPYPVQVWFLPVTQSLSLSPDGLSEHGQEDISVLCYTC